MRGLTDMRFHAQKQSECWWSEVCVSRRLDRTAGSYLLRAGYPKGFGSTAAGGQS